MISKHISQNYQHARLHGGATTDGFPVCDFFSSGNACDADNRRHFLVFRQPPGWDWTKQIPTTLCFFNIAMENRSFIDDFYDGFTFKQN